MAVGDHCIHCYHVMPINKGILGWVGGRQSGRVCNEFRGFRGFRGNKEGTFVMIHGIMDEQSHLPEGGRVRFFLRALSLRTNQIYYERNETLSSIIILY